MKPSTLTRSDVEAVFARLQGAGFRMPEGWPTGSADLLRVAQRWVADLGTVSPGELQAATTDYIRSGVAYWPTPGQLMARVKYRAVGDYASLRAPDPDTCDWYALRRGSAGPVVRYLAHTEGHARGLARAADTTCGDAACDGTDGCRAVEVELLATGRYVRFAALTVRPRVWLWAHTVAAHPRRLRVLGAHYAEDAV